MVNSIALLSIMLEIEVIDKSTAVATSGRHVIMFSNIPNHDKQAVTAM